jgi:hypothetical protein
MSLRQLVNIVYAILVRDRDSDSRAEFDRALNDDLAGTQTKQAIRVQRTNSLGSPIKIGETNG